MGWVTIRETYEPVRWPESRSGKCPVCGKRVRRSTTFQQTLNPFNKNAAGEPKTRSEIWAELKVKAAGWEPDFTHAACEEAGQ